MERINNEKFKKKSIPERTWYLKDCDDNNQTNFRILNVKLKAIIWLLSTMMVMVAGYMFDQIFLS